MKDIEELDIKELDGIIIVSPNIEMDLYNAGTIKFAVNKILDDRKKIKLVMNLHKVKSIDSSGLGILTYLLGKIHEEGGIFVICELNSSVQGLLKKVKLDSIMRIFPTETEAIEAI